MKKTNVTLSDLRKAYEQWAGPPVASLELRDNKSNDMVPIEMDILFFEPADEDNLPEEEYFTFIATAGMSIYVMQGPCKQVELILRIQGRQHPDDLLVLGQKLGELAVLAFREGFYLAPNMIVRNVSLPLFENMDCILVTNWGVYSPEYLPGIKPRVQLLWIKPIYTSEADIIEEIGDIESSRRFLKEGINWDDPKRTPAQLKDLRAEEEFKKGEDLMTNPNVENVIRKIWTDIESWYSKNALRLLKDLREGASEKQISDLEGHLGVLLPDDYKASLRIHNGEVYVNDYNYHNTGQVLNIWSTMTKLSEDGVFKGKEVENTGGKVIQDSWWHRGWIPFAEDSGGNMLCIDMAPAVNGVAGQIIYMELQTGPSASRYKSFRDWLESYKDDLYRGRYEIDKDGYLIERLK